MGENKRCVKCGGWVWGDVGAIISSAKQHVSVCECDEREVRGKVAKTVTRDVGYLLGQRREVENGDD